MKLTAKQFRVLNYRNIDDSGWIPLERVTAFVGRNESGKTALLKALHKFNPAVEESYSARREFPRDRFDEDYSVFSPVCRVEFELSDEFRKELGEFLNGAEVPKKAFLTRFYDGNLEIEYDTEVPEYPVDPEELTTTLDVFVKAARHLAAPAEDQEEVMQALRTELANWADGKKSAVGELEDLRTETGVELLGQVLEEANGYAQPATADLVEVLHEKVKELHGRATAVPVLSQLDKVIEGELPVFIYFENYGILDSTVYLPRFLEDLATDPENPRIRTINAMFKLGKLDAAEIAELGQPVPEDMIQRGQESMDLRSMKLNSASLDISKKFNQWFGQRQYEIKYQADGQYFRILVSDDRRPGVNIELESRSKGFQWFFSFYLIFLAESDGRHKDAILLLDEPGLHLHPTAQQELMSFFERLSEDNPLIYTTHSPFLIDGEHIHRVRPVTEDDTGHSRISVEGWPQDRETIFPLQAAAGYAMVKGLFQHKKNVLVEGLSDYLYLHSLNLHCHVLGRQSLPEDIYITPCGGTKHVGPIASLFLGQKVSLVVLLDSDDAGRARRDALMKKLYAGHEKAVLMLEDVLKKEKCEIEDILGEAAILPTLKKVVGKKVSLNQDDRGKGSLVDQIKSAAGRHGVELPDGWKPEVARRIVVAWSTTEPKDMPEEILDRAEALFKALTSRFEGLKP